MDSMESFKQKAVVFDCAGTLVEMYRVTKELKTGIVLSDADNLQLVSGVERCGLIILDTPIDLIKSQDPDALLSDFLRTEQVPFGIAYATKGFETSDISRILLSDMTKICHFHETNEKAVAFFEDIIYEVSGFVADSNAGEISYVMSTGGKLFDNAREVMDALRDEFDIFIASGDNYENLYRVAEKLGIPDDHVFGLCNDQKKLEIVLDLENHYPYVAMVGDGLNDKLALEASDCGILISRHNYYTPDELKEVSDYILSDLGQCVEILREV
ncbi:HAD family hydrolase [Methanolapillus ohkumae]